MQASHIREGQWYAINTKPRKGVKPENLHQLSGTRKVKVLAKGVERYAEHAKDSCGDPDGDYKNDGIRVSPNPDVEDQSSVLTHVIKPRDVLMPWSEYQQRVEQDEAEAAAKQAERERKAQELADATAAVTARLLSMGLSPDPDNSSTFHDGLFSIWGNSVRMTIPSMNKLLDSVSERVYELLASAD